MANFTCNIALASWAEMVRDGPANLGVLFLKTAEADDALRDHEDLAALLGAAGNTEADFTGYARKTAITGTLTVDHTNNWVDLDIPDQIWDPAGGATNNGLVDMVTYYQNSAADSGRVPQFVHDFVTTTDGSSLTSQINAAGLARSMN